MIFLYITILGFPTEIVSTSGSAVGLGNDSRVNLARCVGGCTDLGKVVKYCIYTLLNILYIIWADLTESCPSQVYVYTSVVYSVAYV